MEKKQVAMEGDATSKMEELISFIGSLNPNLRLGKKVKVFVKINRGKEALQLPNPYPPLIYLSYFSFFSLFITQIISTYLLHLDGDTPQSNMEGLPLTLQHDGRSNLESNPSKSMSSRIIHSNTDENRGFFLRGIP